MMDVAPFDPFAFAIGGAAYEFVATPAIHDLHGWARLEEGIDG
jgi:hypothetical protein